MQQSDTYKLACMLIPRRFFLGNPHCYPGTFPGVMPLGNFHSVASRPEVAPPQLLLRWSNNWQVTRSTESHMCAYVCVLFERVIEIEEGKRSVLFGADEIMARLSPEEASVRSI